MVIVGEKKVIFKCVFSDNITDDVIWSHDNSPITNTGSKYQIDVKDGGSVHLLTINNVDETDVGQYSIRCDQHDLVSTAALFVPGELRYLLTYILFQILVKVGFFVC